MVIAFELLFSSALRFGFLGRRFIPAETWVAEAGVAAARVRGASDRGRGAAVRAAIACISGVWCAMSDARAHARCEDDAACRKCGGTTH